jgi:hypothetical protein
MLDDYVARELPSKVRLAKFLQWNDRRMNSKVDK